MNIRAICEGRFALPLRPAEAVRLFTPEGERRWAGPSWDPVYATAPTGDGSAPGTVFSTDSHGGTATWIVLERHEHAVSHARVVPGRTAGTVSVTCAPDPATDATTVSVRYDISSLGEDGTAFVAAFQARYEAFLQHWRQAIQATLGSGPDVPDGPAGPSLPAKP